MKRAYRYIHRSEVIILNNLQWTKPIPVLNMFSSGGFWMANRMGINSVDDKVIRDFNVYGIIKYGLSLIFATSAFLVTYSYNIPPAIILAILVFYLVEVHFLFLFPLIIDKVKAPLWSSVKMTYSVGLISCLMNTMAIAQYMLFGLLEPHYPYKKWYTGCLAIIFWYQDEVRNRI